MYSVRSKLPVWNASKSSTSLWWKLRLPPPLRDDVSGPNLVDHLINFDALLGSWVIIGRLIFASSSTWFHHHCESLASMLVTYLVFLQPTSVLYIIYWLGLGWRLSYARDLDLALHTTTVCNPTHWLYHGVSRRANPSREFLTHVFSSSDLKYNFLADFYFPRARTPGNRGDLWGPPGRSQLYPPYTWKSRRPISLLAAAGRPF
jgi:hypothetical protein